MKDVADAVAKMGSEQISEYEASGSVEVEYKAKGSSDVQRETLQAGELQASQCTLFNLSPSSSHNQMLPFSFSVHGHVTMFGLADHHTSRW